MHDVVCAIYFLSATPLFLLRTRQRLNTVGIGWCLQVNRAITISIRWRSYISCQVLNVKLLRQLLVELVDPGSLLGARLNVRCVQTLRIRFRGL